MSIFMTQIVCVTYLTHTRNVFKQSLQTHLCVSVHACPHTSWLQKAWLPVWSVTPQGQALGRAVGGNAARLAKIPASAGQIMVTSSVSAYVTNSFACVCIVYRVAIERFHSIPRDNRAAMSLYWAREGDSYSTVESTPTWRPWRHLKMLYISPLGESNKEMNSAAKQMKNFEKNVSSVADFVK